MTDEQLNEIETLAEEATPGLWGWTGSNEVADLWAAGGAIPVLRAWSDSNIAFMQAMREHALPLVKALREAREDRDKYKAALDAELPATWREDIESLNSCLERIGKERDEARSEAAELRKKRNADLLALEKAMDASAKGSWMARALDAERERDDARRKAEKAKADAERHVRDTVDAERRLDEVMNAVRAASGGGDVKSMEETIRAAGAEIEQLKSCVFMLEAERDDARAELEHAVAEGGALYEAKVAQSEAEQERDEAWALLVALKAEHRPADEVRAQLLAEIEAHAETRAEVERLREIVKTAGDRLRACAHHLTEHAYQEMADALFDLPASAEVAP